MFLGKVRAVRVPAIMLGPSQKAPYWDLHKVYYTIEGGFTPEHIKVCRRLVDLYFKKWGHVLSKEETQSLRCQLNDLITYVSKGSVV